MAIELKLGRYKMRNGNIAVITELDPHNPLRLVAEGNFEGTRRKNDWYPDGKFLSAQISNFDLVEYLGPVEPEIKRIDDMLPDLGKKPSVNLPVGMWDWYAGMALQGILTNNNSFWDKAEVIAKSAGKYADAMMEERKKRERSGN